MDTQEPFGFAFLQIIGSVILVGVVGIALIDYWIADFAHLLGILFDRDRRELIFRSSPRRWLRRPSTPHEPSPSFPESGPDVWSRSFVSPTLVFSLRPHR
jgi:hypothetical protein